MYSCDLFREIGTFFYYDPLLYDKKLAYISDWTANRPLNSNISPKMYKLDTI